MFDTKLNLAGAVLLFRDCFSLVVLTFSTNKFFINLPQIFSGKLEKHYVF